MLDFLMIAGISVTVAFASYYVGYHNARREWVRSERSDTINRVREETVREYQSWAISLDLGKYTSASGNFRFLTPAEIAINYINSVKKER